MTRGGHVRGAEGRSSPLQRTQTVEILLRHCRAGSHGSRRQLSRPVLGRRACLERAESQCALAACTRSKQAVTALWARRKMGSRGMVLTSSELAPPPHRLYCHAFITAGALPELPVLPMGVEILLLLTFGRAGQVEFPEMLTCVSGSLRSLWPALFLLVHPMPGGVAHSLDGCGGRTPCHLSCSPRPGRGRKRKPHGCRRAPRFGRPSALRHARSPRPR